MSAKKSQTSTTPSNGTERIASTHLPKRRESLGPRRAAEVLGVSLTTMYRMINEGDIPAFRVRHSIRITVANLLYYRRANRLVKRSPITGYWAKKQEEKALKNQ